MNDSDPCIPLPAISGFTIYTKSSCKFCTLAKEWMIRNHFVDVKIVDCDSFLGTFNRPRFLAVMDQWSGHQPRTFPMIFFGDIFVGGYTDLDSFLEKNSVNWEL